MTNLLESSLITSIVFCFCLLDVCFDLFFSIAFSIAWISASISSLIFSRSENKLQTSAMLGLEMRFPAPVRPDEELTLIEVFVSKRVSSSRPAYGIVSSRSNLRNARGEDVMVMQSNFLVERRADESGAGA